MSGLIDEDLVARFIEENPDLFQRRPSLLTSIRLPDPHDGRALSLGERQAQIMRERIHLLESRLSEFLRHGRHNDAIDERLARWAVVLLSERDESKLPEVVVDGLVRIFEIPSAALRIWKFAPRFAALRCTAAVGDDVLRLANSMQAPFCGPNAGFEAASWLSGNGASSRSLALIALRTEAAAAPFGMLALGSPDPQRFTSGMGTAFLSRIGDLSAAALSRLQS
jgi:uncharacterized protein